jgi:hypothetical protein
VFGYLGVAPLCSGGGSLVLRNQAGKFGGSNAAVLVRQLG